MPAMELTRVRKILPSPSGGEPLVVLDDVHMRIESGEKVGILGRSGSGKSTLLSIVGILDSASSGRYFLGERDIAALPSRERDSVRAKTFGFVFQRFCLMAHLSAVENVEACLIHRGQPRSGRRERALSALSDVGLASRAQHLPGQLSGGEQQRVGLARALVSDAPVILADEPTGALDEATGASVMDLMLELTESRGTALVVATHDPLIVRGFDRTITIEHGRVSDS